MDMQSLIEKSHIGHWMKRSGKTFDDLDKYEKYEYEQTIKLLKITMKQFDMVNSSTKTIDYNSVQRARDGGEPMRHYLSKENQYGLMPELLDKIIDLGLDIGIYCDLGKNGRKTNPIDHVAFSFEPDIHAVGGKVAHQKWKEKVNLVNESFRDLTTQNTSHNDLTMYVELAERIRDVNVEHVSLKRSVNTEIFCIKEEFKFETERNKEIQDKTIVDMGNLLSRIEKQQEEINKQTEMNDAIRTSIVALSETDTSELFTDVNREILSIKEELKLEIEINKAMYKNTMTADRERWELERQAIVDMGSLLSRIEKQQEKINKQTEMINVLTASIETKEENIKSMVICNRIVFGVLIIVYITFEIYKKYNFESREDGCQVKQITHN